MNHKNIQMLLVILLLPFVLMGDAYAYLDPATGSMILQIILGFILAASMAIKMYWRRLKAFFSRNKAQPEEELKAAEHKELPAQEELSSGVK